MLRTFGEGVKESDALLSCASLSNVKKRETHNTSMGRTTHEKRIRAKASDPDGTVLRR
jgi:hypothetical protein